MGNGTGIAFIFALMFIAIICIVWIVVWLPKGFRLRRRGNQGHIRTLALWTVGAIIMLMLCFPPHLHTGEWSDSVTNAPIPAELQTLYDRDEFGYIPTFAWIGRHSETETPECSTTLTLEPHRAYHLDGVGWTVYWWFLVGQLGIVLLFAFPFLTACNDNRASEQPKSVEVDKSN
jgi:hypothetical protein